MDFTLGWIALPLGIAFGLIPPRWLYADGCRHLGLLEARSSGLRRAGSISSSNRRRRRWWKLPLVWLDPFRGYACGWLTSLGLAEIPQYGSAQSALVLVLKCLIIFGVVVMQMELGRQERGALLAPVGFLLGLATGFYGAVGAAICLLGVATMLATHSFMWGYVVSGVAAIIVGLLFFGPKPAFVAFVATTCAPAPYAFLRRAALLFPLRG